MNYITHISIHIISQVDEEFEEFIYKYIQFYFDKNIDNQHISSVQKNKLKIWIVQFFE